MKSKIKLLGIFLLLVISNYVQAATTLTVDAKLNCLNIGASPYYLPGGKPVILTGLKKGQYVVEVKSSNANFGDSASPVKEVVVWYGSRIKNSTTWFQSVRIGQPVVIDHSPEYPLYAFIPDLYCENNMGATVISVRKVSP